MSNEIELPDYLKAMVASGDAKDDSAQLISASTSVPRISLKGRQFRFIVDGEEVSKQSDPIHVVILGAQPEQGMSKTYYKGVYNPNDTDPPTCSSSNGIAPDSWVSEPQSKSCAGCEFNKWGSAKALSGKKAKACRDSKRLMVVKPDQIDGGLIYILNVTVSSLRALSEYGKVLVKNHIPMAAAITTVSMADSDFPQIELSFAGVLKEEQGKAAMSRSADKEWDSFNGQPVLEQAAKAPALEQRTEESKPDKAAAPASDSDVDEIIGKW